jgi:hypothetical protein
MADELAKLGGQGLWQIKYLYDGACPICSSMKELLERRDQASSFPSGARPQRTPATL